MEVEVRHTVLEFLRHLVMGQYSTLDIMRAQIFRYVNKSITDIQKHTSLLSERRYLLIIINESIDSKYIPNECCNSFNNA